MPELFGWSAHVLECRYRLYLKVQIKYQHVSVRLTVSGSFYDNFGQKVKCKRNVPTEQKYSEVGMGFSEWEV